MAETLEIKTDVPFDGIISQWCRQAGHFDKAISPEHREKKYNEALVGLFCMFSKHHEELDDGVFVRAFRFFSDAGITKRLGEESIACQRYRKLERKEPE